VIGDANVKIKDLQEIAGKRFDVVIVGAGSAGSRPALVRTLTATS
jgi:hypothetical protein